MTFQEIAKHAYYNPVWSAWSKHRGLGELSRGHLTQQGMGWGRWRGLGEDQGRLPGGSAAWTRTTVRKTARHAQLQELNHPSRESLDSLRDVQRSLAQRIRSVPWRQDMSSRWVGDITVYQGDSRSFNEVKQDTSVWPYSPKSRETLKLGCCAWNYSWLCDNITLSINGCNIDKNVKCTYPLRSLL